MPTGYLYIAGEANGSPGSSYLSDTWFDSTACNKNFMATYKQRGVQRLLLENTGMSVSEAMRRMKYKPGSSKNPQQLTRSKGMRELMDLVFPEDVIATKHRQLLNAHKIEHMVFPLAMTDEMITELLAQANCIVKKFMHSETQTHVWFFTADNQAQDKALDKVYKLRGEYAPEEHDVNVKGLSLVDLYEKAKVKKNLSNKKKPNARGKTKIR